MTLLKEDTKYDCDDCKYYPCVLQVCFGMKKKKPLGLCRDKIRMEKNDKSIDYHMNRIKEIQKETTKLAGNLTCRVMLRQLNCEFPKDKVIFSVKEIFHWFETGQHLKGWKEIDTL